MVSYQGDFSAKSLRDFVLRTPLEMTYEGDVTKTRNDIYRKRDKAQNDVYRKCIAVQRSRLKTRLSFEPAHFLFIQLIQFFDLTGAFVAVEDIFRPLAVDFDEAL